MDSFTNCSQKEDQELKECMESSAFSHEEYVLDTNHRGHIQTYFSWGIHQVHCTALVSSIIHT